MTRLLIIGGSDAGISAVLRFTRADPEKRTFRPARMTYFGHGGWHELWSVETGPLAGLVKRLVPTLGTDEFFELH